MIGVVVAAHGNLAEALVEAALMVVPDGAPGGRGRHHRQRRLDGSYEARLRVGHRARCRTDARRPHPDRHVRRHAFEHRPHHASARQGRGAHGRQPAHADPGPAAVRDAKSIWPPPRARSKSTAAGPSPSPAKCWARQRRQTRRRRREAALSRTVVIANDLGIHLRAAGALVQVAGRFQRRCLARAQ